MVTTLPPAASARLRRQRLTYDTVGATTPGGPPVPSGWHSFAHERVLERRDLQDLAEELFAWRMQEHSGLRAASSEVPLVEGTVVVLRLGVGALSLRIPCRVVAVHRSGEEAWFAYGTLPGHPERGEERFGIRRRDDGAVVAYVVAFSRPASVLTRLGGPATRAFQRVMAHRYLRALDR
ncbi:DUF1990 domain-containing protein [Nocardioidaceae bacterium]|nr:DUF1990 domain-containing protein [Nocardioidaceae bacterium]